MTMPAPSSRPRTLRLLYSRHEIADAVERLAGELARDYAGQEPVLVGVLSGAFMFLSDLARALPLPSIIEWVRLGSYGSGTESSGKVEWLLGPSLDLRGQPVIIVEDIVDTGRTAYSLMERLKRHEPASLVICALLDKRARREVEVPVRYVGFMAPNEFIVGYGLDYAEQYRNLPDLYVLEGGV